MIPGAIRVGAGSVKPSGICYRVLTWRRDLFSDAEMSEWKQQRRAFLERMRDAGIKGSRGLLRELEEELKALTHNLVEDRLTTRCTGEVFCARAEGDAQAALSSLAESLAGDAAVLAYRLHPAWAEIVVQLTAEEGLDALLARHSTVLPAEFLYTEQLTELLPPDEANAFRESCRSLMAAQQAEVDAAADSATPFRHVTVLAGEAVDLLQPAAGRVMVDATLGGGGHTERLLEGGATVYGIDQDPAARAAAKKRLAAYGDRLRVIAGNFRSIKSLLQEQGISSIDGLLADIGISSPQVDNAERGFSFLNDGPLDMRMNPAAPRSAADIVATASENELADILWQYGEEKASRAIARRIVQERDKAPITTTTQLANIIAAVLPRKGKQHPATRSFQALRIAVNDELGALEELLRAGVDLLASGGRFAVITFHSLEDRAVKRFFESITKAELDRPEWPAPRPNPKYSARLITRKPVTAGAEELAVNPRARSAKLRVIEKL